MVPGQSALLFYIQLKEDRVGELQLSPIMLQGFEPAPPARDLHHKVM
jgi:hypothetical protein